MTRYVATDVTSAFDAAGINDNFQRIETSIAQLLSLVGDIPNSMQANLDMNGYAILNQLNPLTLEAFHWLGPWATATAYSVDDAVFFNSSAYVCIEAHTSGTFGADLAADKWQIICQGTTDRGTWTGPNTYYFIGDIITDGSDLYRCLVNNLSTASFANDLAAGWWVLYTNFLGSMALQNANAVAITGGSLSGVTVTGSTINSSAIGGSVPAQGNFTTAFDGGGTPATAAQLANKNYVDGQITSLGPRLPKAFGMIAWGGASYSVSVGSYNIASLTRNSAGNVTVHFTTAMANATYTVLTDINAVGNFDSNYNTPATTDVVVELFAAAGTPVDTSFSIAIFENV